MTPKTTVAAGIIVQNKNAPEKRGVSVNKKNGNTTIKKAKITERSKNSPSRILPPEDRIRRLEYSKPAPIEIESMTVRKGFRVLAVSIVILLVVAWVFILSACNSPLDAPPIEGGNSYHEASYNDTPEVAEATGFVLDGETWFEITGHFDGQDNDYFRLELDADVDGLTIVGYKETPDGFAAVAPGDGGVGFPVRVAAVDVAGRFLADKAPTEVGGRTEAPADTSYILLRVFERPAELRSGDHTEDAYSHGRAYKVLIR